MQRENENIAKAKQNVESALKAKLEAAKQVKHPARTATLVWTGVPNNGVATVSRLTRNIALSVMDASAAFQTQIDVPQPTIEVHQSSQILLPVKLERRNKFDQNVTLTFAGFDNKSKFQVENKPLNKGESEGIRRLFVPKDAPPGAYTVYLNSQAQESYERNPKAIAEAKTQQEQADAAQKAADEANKQAVTAQTKAVNDAKAADGKLKQATQASQTAEKGCERFTNGDLKGRAGSESR